MLDCEVIASSKHNPLSNTGIAACHRRSPVRSECQPLNCCVRNPARYGNAVSIVTRKSLCDDARFTIVGSQKAIP